jgi:integrase/recombinase XerD
MTPLRKRMTEDLQLKGYAKATQESYLKSVCKLACHYGKSPDQVSEEELRAYFLHLGQVERCSRGTLKIAISGIRFFFAVTLQRQWPVLGLIRAGKEKKLPVVLSRAEVRTVLGCVRAPVYRSCLNTIYGCGLRIGEGVAVQVGEVDGERKFFARTG